MELWIFWVVLGLIMLMIELFTGTLYFLWFGLAGIITAFIAYVLPDKIWLQLVVAAVLVLVLSLSTPKFAKKFGKKSPGYKENKYDLVGKNGVVVSTIRPNGSGVVKIVGHGEWTAVTKGTEIIEEGSEVKVEEMKGLVVTVAPVKTVQPD